MLPAATPLLRLDRLGRELGINLWVKRDDLFPATGGGNKARKLPLILAEPARKGCNALVTTGGLQSNHARATALEAARRGWACTLVLHGDPGQLGSPTGNLLLSLLVGAQVRVVEPAAIAQSMSDAMQQFRDQGYTPWEIPGGGHCLAGGMAYVEAVSELADQCQQVSWWPDCVVVASGTGSTQAGIVAGFQQLERRVRVLGVSIARQHPHGKRRVEELYRELCSHLESSAQSGAIEVHDQWIGDGYERPTQAALSAISMAAQLEGLMLDPTYTGKAFRALVDWARQEEFARTPNVLFWHTGGLVNLLASDCFREARDWR